MPRVLVYLSVRLFVCSFIMLVEFTSKFYVKVSQVGISLLQPLVRKYSYLDHGYLRVEGHASLP